LVERIPPGLEIPNLKRTLEGGGRRPICVRVATNSAQFWTKRNGSALPRRTSRKCQKLLRTDARQGSLVPAGIFADKRADRAIWTAAGEAAKRDTYLECKRLMRVRDRGQLVEPPFEYDETGENIIVRFDPCYA